MKLKKIVDNLSAKTQVPVPILMEFRSKNAGPVFKQETTTSTVVRGVAVVGSQADLVRYIDSISKLGWGPGAVVIKVSSAMNVVSPYDYGVVLHHNTIRPRDTQYGPLRVKWISPYGGAANPPSTTDEWPDDLLMLHKPLSNDQRNEYVKMAQVKTKVIH